MKKFTLILFFLLYIVVLINSQENPTSRSVNKYSEIGEFFSGVPGKELSLSEMKQKDGDSVIGFLTVYSACSIAYQQLIGRSLEKDTHRFIIRPVYRTVRRAFRKSWRVIGSRTSRRLYIKY